MAEFTQDQPENEACEAIQPSEGYAQTFLESQQRGGIRISKHRLAVFAAIAALGIAVPSCGVVVNHFLNLEDEDKAASHRWSALLDRTATYGRVDAFHICAKPILNDGIRNELADALNSRVKIPLIPTVVGRPLAVTLQLDHSDKLEKCLREKIPGFTLK